MLEMIILLPLFLLLISLSFVTSEFSLKTHRIIMPRDPGSCTEKRIVIKIPAKCIQNIINKKKVHKKTNPNPVPNYTTDNILYKIHYIKIILQIRDSRHCYG